MAHVNEIIKFFQDNWLTIILIVGVLLIVLKAYADFKVRWAKVTPEKEDDEKAKLFKSKVMVIIQFIKDIFRIKKDKKNE